MGTDGVGMDGVLNDGALSAGSGVLVIPAGGARGWEVMAPDWACVGPGSQAASVIRQGSRRIGGMAGLSTGMPR